MIVPSTYPSMLWAQNPSFQEHACMQPHAPAGALRSNVGFGRGDLFVRCGSSIVKAAAKRFDFWVQVSHEFQKFLIPIGYI
jgi:hypothetical protein